MNIRSFVGRLLFKVARSRAGGVLVRWGFSHASAAIPVRRLAETERVLAFYHPKPSYPLHVLIVPKHSVPTLLALNDAHLPIMSDVIRVTQQLVRELRLHEGGYTLMVNGGAYQDVRQLHFHLVGEVRA